MRTSILRAIMLVAVITLTAFTFGVPASSIAQTSLDTAAIDAFTARIMDLYDIPGASLTMIQDGRVLYTQGYGVRDLSLAAPEPINADTAFALASLTKSFTALAALKLVEAGELDLDTPIVSYVPEFTTQDVAAAKKITMRHLLSHTAGFVSDDVAWYTGKITDREQVVKHIATLPQKTQPGASFSYNNPGYAMAGIVIERISGKTWEDFVTQNVLLPLGMTETTPYFDAIRTLPNHAAPHSLDVWAGIRRTAYFPFEQPTAPAGAMISTANDLVKYALFQLGDGTIDGKQFLPAALMAEMHTEQFQTGYGLGWSLSELDEMPVVWHSGSINGYASLLMLLPELNFAAIALMNAVGSENPGALDAIVHKAVATALDLPIGSGDPYQDWVRRTGNDPQARAKRFAEARDFRPNYADYAVYAGKYITQVELLEIEFINGGLYLNLISPEFVGRIELVEYRPGRFIPNYIGMTNTYIVFTIQPNGSVSFASGIGISGVKPAQ